MLSNEQFEILESNVISVYSSGGDASQNQILRPFMSDTSKIPFFKNIVENPESSCYMNHFALVSLYNLFDLVFEDWDDETILSYYDWCLQNLFMKANTIETVCNLAFCKLYGLLFSFAFRQIEYYQLQLETINSFLNSDIPIYIQTALDLCSNIPYSIYRIKRFLNNEQISFFKETTILTCYSAGSDILSNESFLSDTGIVKSAIELLIASLTFDIDITKESSMIFMPQTAEWNNALSNVNFLLSVASNLYFDNDIPKEVRSPVLDLFFYLTSLRLEYSFHIEYLNYAIEFIIQIIESNPLLMDPNNISKINSIILKINSSITSDDSKKIPLFKQFISTVFNYTMQFFDPQTFILNINDIMTLLDFWSKISRAILSENKKKKVKKLTAISKSLYDIIINAALSNVDFFSEIGPIFFYNLSSFVYKIGINNDRDFFKDILTNFGQFQDELYDCYDSYLNKEGDFDYQTSLKSFELKVAYSALIISAPIIRPINVQDDYLVGYSMIDLINFFLSSEERITKNPMLLNYDPDEIYKCSIIENVVLFIISQIEKGTSIYIEKSFTSLVISEIPIKTIEKLHAFFLSRALSIVKTYPSNDLIVETVFDSILEFYSLRSNDITSIYLCDTFLDDFLYKKMRLKPNKKDNIFQPREWTFSQRVKFHKIFSILLSGFSHHMTTNTFNKSDYEQRKANFLFYLRDLRIRIENMENDTEADNYLNDLYGLFREAQTSEAYSILESQFFSIIPSFKHFQVNFHFILRFLAEFTENRNNRIVFSRSNIKKKDEIQSKSLSDLLFFKQASLFLIQFFEVFQTNPQNVEKELKYVYRILSNIFKNYSTCIGAMKLYGDNSYTNIFNSTVFNTNRILITIDSFINLQNPEAHDMKLLYIILNFITVLGNEKDLFMDTYRQNNQFFKNSLFLIGLIIKNIKFLLPNILDKLIEIADLITRFFTANKNNKIGIELLLTQKSNLQSLSIFINSTLNILYERPQLTSIHACCFIYNFITSYPNEELAIKIHDIVTELLDIVTNKDVVRLLQIILSLFKKESDQE